jgi:hypothetical protein
MRDITDKHQKNTNLMTTTSGADLRGRALMNLFSLNWDSHPLPMDVIEEIEMGMTYNMWVICIANL